MKNNIIILLFLPLIGCSVASINKHRPNFKSVRAVEKLGTNYNAKVTVPKIIRERPKDDYYTKGMTEQIHPYTKNLFQCRAAPFYTPQGIPVYKYFENSLIDELDAGGKLDKENGEQIIVDIKVLDGDSVTGMWNIDINYKVSGENYRVKTAYPFDSAFSAQTACTNMAHSLTEALSENFLSFFKRLPSEDISPIRNVSSAVLNRLIRRVKLLEEKVRKLEGK